MPDRDVLLEVVDRLGKLEGRFEGIATLIREGVVEKISAHIDHDDDFHSDHEKRVRALEDDKSQRAGTERANTKWTAAIAAGVTLIVNGVFMLIGKAGAH